MKNEGFPTGYCGVKFVLAKTSDNQNIHIPLLFVNKSVLYLAVMFHLLHFSLQNLKLRLDQIQFIWNEPFICCYLEK